NTPFGCYESGKKFFYENEEFKAEDIGRQFVLANNDFILDYQYGIKFCTPFGLMDIVNMDDYVPSDDTFMLTNNPSYYRADFLERFKNGDQFDDGVHKKLNIFMGLLREKNFIDTTFVTARRNKLEMI